MINPTKYIPIEKTVPTKYIAVYFDFELSNSIYSPFGVESESTIYNTFSFYTLFVLITIIHLWVILLKKQLWRVSNQNWWAYLWAKYKLILNKISDILTFGYYIRIVLEMNQFLLIWSIKEIYAFDGTHTLRIISLVFAFLVFIFCSFIFITVYLFVSSYNFNNDEHCKLGEFYWGIQMWKKNKIYIIVLQLRRVLFIAMMITLTFISSKILIGMLSSIQLIYLIYIVILRPFKEIKWNIIEIINELYFLFFLSWLILLNSKNDWKSTYTDIYIWSIFSYFICTSIIVISKQLIIIV